MANAIRGLAALIGLLCLLLAAGCGDGLRPVSSWSEEEDSDWTVLRVELFDRNDTPPGAPPITDNFMTQYIRENFGNPNRIKVEFVTIPRSEEVRRLDMLMAANQAPDIVFTYDMPLFYKYASQGKLTDLAPYIEEHGRDLRRVLGEEVLDEGRFDGKQLAIPARRVLRAHSTSVIRQDWLDMLGIPLPETTEQFYEALVAMSSVFEGGEEAVLGVGIIGAGAISPAHIQAYLEFRDRCKIVAVCDLYEEKARRRIGEYGLEAEAYVDYGKLLEREDIGLVSVCTPPYTHAEIAMDVMRAGKHVIVEKPMASSLEECDAMIEVAKQCGKVLSVIAQNRFTTPMMKLKAVLDTGLAGPIVHAQVDSYWWRGYSYYDLWWRGTWEKEGGGCTLNHAVHHIDLFQWMAGMPSEITAVMSNTSHDNAEVEDLSIAIARYDNGMLAQITSSVVHHGEEQQLVFQGRRARVSAPWKPVASRSRPNGFPDRDAELEAELRKVYDELPELQYEGHRGQILDVLNAIEHGTPVLVDGIQGRRTLNSSRRFINPPAPEARSDCRSDRTVPSIRGRGF